MITVKNLEWGNARITEDGREAEDAESPVGRYIATDTGWFLVGRTGYEVERGLYQAKAAAQADYEARILSELETFEARELALEPFARLAEEVFRDGMNSEKTDDCPIWGFNNAVLTYGHLRASQRALSSPDHADATHPSGGDRHGE